MSVRMGESNREKINFSSYTNICHFISSSGATGMKFRRQTDPRQDQMSGLDSTCLSFSMEDLAPPGVRVVLLSCPAHPSNTLLLYGRPRVYFRRGLGPGSSELTPGYLETVRGTGRWQKDGQSSVSWASNGPEPGARQLHTVLLGLSQSAFSQGSG